MPITQLAAMRRIRSRQSRHGYAVELPNEHPRRPMQRSLRDNGQPRSEASRMLPVAPFSPVRRRLLILWCDSVTNMSGLILTAMKSSCWLFLFATGLDHCVHITARIVQRLERLSRWIMGCTGLSPQLHGCIACFQLPYLRREF